MDKIQGAKIVVIGGGTGSFVMLSGLKNYTADLTALVSMADDGGSTGKLRDELGVLPGGDVRQCLVALSRSPRVRDLFNYRFDEGSLAGHSFGNLFLAATEKMTGSFRAGVELAGEILNTVGRVEPIITNQVTLLLDDGKKILRGEDTIDDGKFSPRPKIWLEPKPKVNPMALKAIKNADVVVVAPGSLYESLGTVLITPGVSDALTSTKAKVVYVCNLVNKAGQTDGFSVHDYASELERLAGKPFIDYVIYNTNEPGQELLELYAAEGSEPVQVDTEALRAAHYKAKGADMLANRIWQNPNQKSDPKAMFRTLIRHDPDKAARAVMKIYFS
ncbi:YvcK family protein [Candidatus Saccharibacteria bacterium]|nr:YvcK family protein [Candidatus Saccharibacteria bacterium]